ncbi:MAG: endonuclease III [Oscillospiraceae bacterium]|nr:endonuclease III [Oscillospiraceae bacterium]
MLNKKQALKIIKILEDTYPLAQCTLSYEKDYELLFATRLAAQCTDERVNRITPAFFSAFPTLEAIAQADVSRVEEYIRPCGFYHSKAKDIVAAAKMLVSEYSGRVPDTMEELLKLPGVGRKTANLILGDVFGKPAVVVDTHCIRLSNRMGLSDTKDPAKIEAQLKDKLPPDKSSDFCHRIVLHGRAVCSARKPDCENCPVNAVCEKNL